MSILAIAFISWGMSDIDGDGLASFDEMGKTQPMQGDSDGDGASDGWERINGFDPITADRFDLMQVDPNICDDVLGGARDIPQTTGCGPEGGSQQAAQQGSAPSVSSGQAQTTAIIGAIGALALSALGGIFTGRTILRRGM
jgi:hypothetical protein